MATKGKEVIIVEDIELTEKLERLGEEANRDGEIKEDKNDGEKYLLKINKKTIQLIETILRENIKEITIDESKRDELESAMAERKTETVKRLLEEGAPIDTYIYEGDEKGDTVTPLTFAAKIDRLDIFCLVLSQAIRKGWHDSLFINTAMQKVCMNNSVMMAKILLKRNLNFKCIYDDFHSEPQKKMTQRVQKYFYNDYKASYIHFCAFFGSREVLKLLLENHADSIKIDQKDSGGNTALHLASRNGYSTCVSLLLQKGAKVDEVNRAKGTPLLVAIENAPEELIYSLVRAGADVNAEDGKGATPLLISSFKGRDTLIHNLINNGANVEARNRLYQTPLMLACKGGNAAAVRELLLSGASLKVLDKNGADAFTIARDKKQDDALSVIVRAHAAVENFKNLGWHKVLTLELYKSLLTMLDCIIEPELEKNRVNVNFTILEIDSRNITPNEWEYGEEGRRNPYLLQRFASCGNEEIAYHGVTRLLVDQKFKRYGNVLLWLKTFIFISFLAAMVYALAQAAQEHRTPNTLYWSDVRPFTGWDKLRFICEIYVVLFWMSNLVTELAEFIQVIFYARKEIGDTQQEKKSRLEEEQERTLRQVGETREKKQARADEDMKPKPTDDDYDDGGRKSPGGSSIYSKTSQKSDATDKSTKSTKKSDKSGGALDEDKPADTVAVDVPAKTDDGSDDGSLGLGSEEKAKDGDDDSDEYYSDDDSDLWGDDDVDYDYDDYTEYTTERRKSRYEEYHYEELDTEPEAENNQSKIDKFKEALQGNIIVRVFLDYFQDWYNWLDLMGIVLLFILIIFRIFIIINPDIPYVEFQWIVATFAFAINGLRLTKLLSVFNIFGTYMRIIIIILLKDVPKFLLLLLLTFLFFSTTLYLSFRIPIIVGETNGTNGTEVQYYVTLFNLDTLQSEGLDRFYHVLIYPIRVLLEGNALEFNYVFDSLNVVAAVVYMLFLFLIIVVYLNLFVAQLSDTYAEVKANAKKTVARFRLQFIIQTQTTSLLALFFDFRKKFFEDSYIMEDGEWVEYFNAGISQLDEEDFTTQKPTESLYVVINKLQQQQKVNSRTQEILQNSIKKKLKSQQIDVQEIKNKMETKLEALEKQNKEILAKLTQIAQKVQ